MNITSTAATITQVVFTAEIVSSRVGPSAASAALGASKQQSERHTGRQGDTSHGS